MLLMSIRTFIYFNFLKDYNIDLMNINRKRQTHSQRTNSFRSNPKAQLQMQVQRPAKEISMDFMNDLTINIWPSHQKQQYNQTARGYDHFKCGCGFASSNISDTKDHILNQHKGRCLQGSTHYLSPFTQILVPCKKSIEQASFLQSEQTEFYCKGFVLVRNFSFSCKPNNFYCGQCDIYYQEAIGFIQHCLSKCGELQSCLSSHNIYTKDDWQKRNQYDQVHKKNVASHQKNIKSSKKTQFNEISLKQIHGEQSNEDYSKEKDSFDYILERFTLEIIRLKIFKKNPQKKEYSAYRSYFYDYQSDKYMILLNSAKKITSESFKNIACSACNKLFNSLYLFKIHIIEEKCEQSLESTFYLLNKRLFLERYRKRLLRLDFQFICVENLSSKTDPELLYYKISHDQQISNATKRFFLKNKGFIKLYCGDIWTQISKPFECKSCKMTSYSALKLFRHNETKCKSMNSFILIIFKKRDHLNKYKWLSLESNFLAKQPFYCPCNSTKMLTKFQFVTHIIDFHDRYIEIELFSSKP